VHVSYIGLKGEHKPVRAAAAYRPPPHHAEYALTLTMCVCVCVVVLGGRRRQLSRAPVVTTYEASANPADHRVRGTAAWSASYVG
jgi:hypothetical protein